MTWTTPKTDWATTDYFNIDPDYNRIKGNLEYLITAAKQLYGEYTDIEMSQVTISDVPLSDFLNNIVNNITLLDERTGEIITIDTMPLYTGNGRGWTASELNVIEGNCALFYNLLQGQINILPRLAFEMGVSQI